MRKIMMALFPAVLTIMFCTSCAQAPMKESPRTFIETEVRGAGRIAKEQFCTTQNTTLCEETTTVDETTEAEELVSMGVFKLTAYCPCTYCCGWNTGITYSGTQAIEGRTVGVHLEDFEMGDELIINGNIYIAEDTGNFQRGMIDVYFDSHQEALQFGVQYAEVFVRR